VDPVYRDCSNNFLTPGYPVDCHFPLYSHKFSEFLARKKIHTLQFYRPFTFLALTYFSDFCSIRPRHQFPCYFRYRFPSHIYATKTTDVKRRSNSVNITYDLPQNLQRLSGNLPLQSVLRISN